MASAAAQKMAPTVPMLRRFAPHKSQVRLMHQRRRLQRLARFFLGHLGGGQLAELLIDEGQELLRCLRFALFDPRQDQSHVALRTGGCHRFSQGRLFANTVMLWIIRDHGVSPLPQGRPAWRGARVATASDADPVTVNVPQPLGGSG